MAAATLALCLAHSLDSQTHLHPPRSLPLTLSSSSPQHIKKHPFLSPHKSHRFTVKSSFSHPSTTDADNGSSSTYSSLEDSFRTGRFLSNEELEKLRVLQDFEYYQELTSGSMWVRVMRPEEMGVTVELLAESFAESMLLPAAYQAVLRFFVTQYLVERRAVMPHAATLIAFYRGKDLVGGDGGEDDVFAGTVEICFDKRGANASTPTPTPPKNSPYISNMTVTEPLRRRGIGWNLLKASEELISKMSNTREVYLHCRMIDSAPFNMYTKAGYNVVQTDSILVFLLLQRRKHLMLKKIPVLNNAPELDTSDSETELPSQLEVRSYD